MADLSGKTLGRYRLIEKLGEGGMAIVYKALDARLGTEVAVKVIRMEKLTEDTRDRTLKRFEREAKLLARLTHPNIVKVTDFGEFEGKPYLVMEYLAGGTLKQKMGNPMPWQEAVQLLLPIAEALSYAHSQNMIHRDVKPANILFRQSGQPMLADFGIAKIDLDETLDLTSTSAAVGTPEYMAPEQATAKYVDHRADVYSLGVVLFEMVTGRKPFIADTPMAVLIKHATETLPNPTKFSPKLPKEVEKIILKALEKQPEKRFQQMTNLTSAFKRLLDGKVLHVQENKNLIKQFVVIGAFFLAVIIGAGFFISNDSLKIDQITFLPNVPTETNIQTQFPTYDPTSTFNPTKTNTPILIRTATPNPTILGEIAADNVNIRTGPGTNYPVLDYGIKGDVYTILGVAQDRTWYVVLLQDGSRGWVSASIIKLNSPLENLIVSTAPPTPTLQPVALPTNKRGGNSQSGSSDPCVQAHNTFYAIQAAIGSSVGDPNWNPAGDVNGDGKIDIFDYNELLTIWPAGCASP